VHRENRLSGGVVDVEFFGSFLDGFVFIEDLGQESCSEGFCDLVVFTLGVRSLTENFQIDFSKDIFDDFHFCFVLCVIIVCWVIFVYCFGSVIYFDCVYFVIVFENESIMVNLGRSKLIFQMIGLACIKPQDN